MQLIPKNDFLIIKRAKPEDVTKSGIILLGDAQEETQVIWQGEVMDSSNEEYQKGSNVLFSRYLPFEFELDGEKYVALKSTDVLAIITWYAIATKV